MEEVNWNSHVLELEEFMQTDAVSEQLGQVLQFQINLGNANEETT